VLVYTDTPNGAASDTNQARFVAQATAALVAQVVNRMAPIEAALLLREGEIGDLLKLTEGLERDDGAAVSALLARLGGLGDTARDLAYRMYHVAERKGWTDEARSYNALVVAWTDLSRGAEGARASGPAQASLGLE
jgi:hypothetical protein